MSDIEYAIESYVLGDSIEKSALKHGVSRTTLTRRLKQLKLTRKYTKTNHCLPHKHGRITAISISIDDTGRVSYDCSCDCGRKLKMRKLDYFKFTECGRCRNTGEGNHKWKGVGKLSGTCWKHIKQSIYRKSRILEFSISQEYAWELYLLQKGKCALSGLEINFPDKVDDGNFPSLDRIDSSKGYIKDNVQWVHKDLNTMKWSLSQDRFLELCELVTHKYKREVLC